MEELTPDDIISAVNAAAGAMRGSGGDEWTQQAKDTDWSTPARDLDWSCRRTLNHSIDAVLWYATNLATTSTQNSGDVRDGKKDDSPVPALLRALELSGYLLARVVEASPPGARGWHDAGMADATGFLAMGCDETLVHAYDVTAALGLAFSPPAGLCDRTVRRLFPWAPEHDDPWERLLWCNGRIDVPGHPRLGPTWGWWCAPLDEWDGLPRTDRASVN
jgi:hypothetical protein